jgi:hypothetical protein
MEIVRISFTNLVSNYKIGRRNSEKKNQQTTIAIRSSSYHWYRYSAKTTQTKIKYLMSRNT